MKILYLSAGNSIHTVKWANAMANRGHEVFVIACKDHSEGSNKFDERVNVSYLKLSSGLGYYLNTFELKKKVKKISPDIINVHYASGYGTLARLAHLKGFLLNVWGSDVYDFPHESNFKKRTLIRNLKTARYLASTSHSMAEETKKYTNKDIFVTPFGVDIQRFNKMNVEREDKFIFCTVKALMPKYGIVGMIRAFSQFLNKLSEKEKAKVEYHIYGSGDQKEEIENLIKELQLEDKVFLKGYIPNDQVPVVINKCDVFLLKSELDSESFGVAAVEAMACYKPVIASNISGFLEVIEDGHSGIIVDKNNLSTYAEKMYELYLDKDRRDSLGNEGRKRVETLFDWNKNVDTMLDIYEMMVKAK